MSADSDALGEHIAQTRQEYEHQSPEDREQQRAEADHYLEAQRAEIEQER